MTQSSLVRLERLQAILRALTAGGNPERVLIQVLDAVVSEAGGTYGLVCRITDGRVVPLASTALVGVGGSGKRLLEAGQAAITSRRLVRQREGSGGAEIVAQPLRFEQRSVGALVIGGGARVLDAMPLGAYADLAALAIVRQPAVPVSSSAEVVDVLNVVTADLDMTSVLSRAFDAAERLFGSVAGFCALGESQAMRIVHYVGFEREALRVASRHPQFRELLELSELCVHAPAPAALVHLAPPGTVGIGVPLAAPGNHLGRLVLFVSTVPDAAGQHLLRGFGGQVALGLRAAGAARAVGEREEQLASVVHSMASPVLVVDEAGRFAMLNSAASELFRLSHAFELGQPVAGKLHNPVLESLLTGDVDVTTEVVVDAGEDEARAFRATVRRVRSGGGRVLGRLLVLDDVTADREAEQLKADFVAVIGHELRTPLTVMKGYIHTLARRGAQMDDEKRQRAYDALVTNASRLERLIEDLLFVSAIERRRVALDLESCEVGGLLDDQADDRVSVRHPRRKVEAAVDRGRLEQVIHHLLDNARKYSDGPIVLELVDRGEEIEISVSDQGPGIYSGDIPMIFERFRQIDGTGTRAHGGLGIGLYLCRRLVEAQGGRIWCESRLGVGSRFALTLPKDGPADAAVARSPESVAAASHVTSAPMGATVSVTEAGAIDVDSPFPPSPTTDLSAF